MGIVKVTRKRQITLSRDICNKLGVSPGDYVRVYVDKDGRVVIEKALGIDQLAGSLNPGYPVRGLAEELDRERKTGER
ncbi:MAG: AbrB/MazE/SpoVT family DNA-binding domain-containing protein [Desulfurococcales archaeon]|nr:AbrB/MazE/SpoVT family DNA-binding domain-containing protein [Desulfurococcales archaeon]